jgi:hypothetical protein
MGNRARRAKSWTTRRNYSQEQFPAWQSFAVVRENVRTRGAPGVVERLLETVCEPRMETPTAAPMGLASQSLLVRDDGGVYAPFQYRGAGSNSASELKLISIRDKPSRHAAGIRSWRWAGRAIGSAALFAGTCGFRFRRCS